MENNSASESNMKIEPVVEPKMEIETKPAASIKEKRSSKEEKSRKKDDKSIEQILKNLNSLETPEEKLSVMCKRYIEVLDENRKLQMTLKQNEKKVLMIQKEKEQCQSEKSKAVLARSRLESLCRELQRQNKAVKEESLLKIREEEEKRKEVSAKFQSTLAEITTLMAETNEKNVKLHDDNMEIHKKFKSVFDEMDIREQHFEGMHQMMKHELQVAEAKLAKVTLEMTEDKEALLKEKNQLLFKLTEYQTRIHELQQVEANLRSQINMYTDKYDEFQTALTKSNEVFGGFNDEMEKMSKKILKLEKETNLWKSRWQKSQAALLEMVAHKQTKDTEIATVNKKCSLLQELCKAFQQERSTLLAQLKEKCNKDSPESNEESKTEDNQKLIENIENSLENAKINGSILLDDLNTKIEEQTKELKTETMTCLKTETIETGINDSSRENQDSNKDSKSEIKDENKEFIENNSTMTVKNENKNLVVESLPVQMEENQQTIDKTNKIDKQENSLEFDKGKQIELVPIEVKSSTDTVTVSSEEPLDPPEVTNEEETKNAALNTTNIVDLQNEFECNQKTENRLQESMTCEVKDAPKVENCTDKVVPNGDVQSNPVTNKKHKDGKKKKK